MPTSVQNCWLIERLVSNAWCGNVVKIASAMCEHCHVRQVVSKVAMRQCVRSTCWIIIIALYRIKWVCFYSHCIQQVLDAVLHCHQSGVIHRDLKVFIALFLIVKYVFDRTMLWSDLPMCSLVQCIPTTSTAAMPGRWPWFVCLFTPPLPRDGGTAWIHAVNLIEIRLGKRWQLISNQSWVTGSPTTNKADCHWWVPKSRLTCWVSNFTIVTRWSTGGPPVCHIKVGASR